MEVQHVQLVQILYSALEELEILAILRLVLLYFVLLVQDLSGRRLLALNVRVALHLPRMVVCVPLVVLEQFLVSVLALAQHAQPILSLRLS